MVLNWLKFDLAGNDSRKAVCDLWLHYEYIVCTGVSKHCSGASCRGGDGRSTHTGGGHQQLFDESLGDNHFALDSVVVARLIWFILALVAGMGPLHLSRLLGSL